MDLISIILPVYNGEKYIESCILSLEQQTYKNLEIIFVDDGSTDKTKQIIKSYCKKYDNIFYYYQTNQRQGTARNTGLRHANGKYVCFIDSDDFIDSNMLKEMHKAIIRDDYDIVLCDYYICRTKDKKYVECCYLPFKDCDRVTPKEYILSTPSPSNKLFKKEFLINNNFKFVEKIIYEDYASIPTLAKYNPKVCYIAKPFLYYMQTDNSTMRINEYKSACEDIFAASEHLYNELKDTPELTSELEFLIIFHMLYNFSIEFNKYKKYDNLGKIRSFVETRFPKWYNNRYFKKKDFKFKLLCYLFFKNHIKIINLVRKWKRRNGS